MPPLNDIQEQPVIPGVNNAPNANSPAPVAEPVDTQQAENEKVKMINTISVEQADNGVVIEPKVTVRPMHVNIKPEPQPEAPEQEKAISDNTWTPFEKLQLDPMRMHKNLGMSLDWAVKINNGQAAFPRDMYTKEHLKQAGFSEYELNAFEPEGRSFEQALGRKHPRYAEGMTALDRRFERGNVSTDELHIIADHMFKEANDMVMQYKDSPKEQKQLRAFTNAMQDKIYKLMEQSERPETLGLMDEGWRAMKTFYWSKIPQIFSSLRLAKDWTPDAVYDWAGDMYKGGEAIAHDQDLVKSKAADVTGSANWLANIAGDIIPQLATQAVAGGVGLLVGGPKGAEIAASSVTFGLTAGSAYDEAYNYHLEAGLSEDEAHDLAEDEALARGVAVSALEKIGYLGTFGKHVPKSVITSVANIIGKSKIGGQLLKGLSLGASKVPGGKIAALAQKYSADSNFGKFISKLTASHGEEFAAGSGEILYRIVKASAYEGFEELTQEVAEDLMKHGFRPGESDIIEGKAWELLPFVKGEDGYTGDQEALGRVSESLAAGIAGGAMGGVGMSPLGAMADAHSNKKKKKSVKEYVKTAPKPGQKTPKGDRESDLSWDDFSFKVPVADQKAVGEEIQRTHGDEAFADYEASLERKGDPIKLAQSLARDPSVDRDTTEKLLKDSLGEEAADAFLDEHDKVVAEKDRLAIPDLPEASGQIEKLADQTQSDEDAKKVEDKLRKSGNDKDADTFRARYDAVQQNNAGIQPDLEPSNDPTEQRADAVSEEDYESELESIREQSEDEADKFEDRYEAGRLIEERNANEAQLRADLKTDLDHEQKQVGIEEAKKLQDNVREVPGLEEAEVNVNDDGEYILTAGTNADGAVVKVRFAKSGDSAVNTEGRIDSLIGSFTNMTGVTNITANDGTVIKLPKTKAEFKALPQNEQDSLLATFEVDASFDKSQASVGADGELVIQEDTDTATIGHEVFHWFKQAGVITAEENAALEKAFGGKHAPGSKESEETIASAYEEWATEKERLDDLADGIVEDENGNYVNSTVMAKYGAKIQKIFRKMYNYFGNLIGAKKAKGNKVFQKIDSGEVGSRSISDKAKQHRDVTGKSNAVKAKADKARKQAEAKAEQKKKKDSRKKARAQANQDPEGDSTYIVESLPDAVGEYEKDADKVRTRKQAKKLRDKIKTKYGEEASKKFWDRWVKGQEIRDRKHATGTKAKKTPDAPQKTFEERRFELMQDILKKVGEENPGILMKDAIDLANYLTTQQMQAEAGIEYEEVVEEDSDAEETTDDDIQGMDIDPDDIESSADTETTPVSTTTTTPEVPPASTVEPEMTPETKLFYDAVQLIMKEDGLTQDEATDQANQDLTDLGEEPFSGTLPTIPTPDNTTEPPTKEPETPTKEPETPTKETESATKPAEPTSAPVIQKNMSDADIDTLVEAFEGDKEMYRMALESVQESGHANSLKKEYTSFIAKQFPTWKKTSEKAEVRGKRIYTFTPPAPKNPIADPKADPNKKFIDEGKASGGMSITQAANRGKTIERESGTEAMYAFGKGYKQSPEWSQRVKEHKERKFKTLNALGTFSNYTDRATASYNSAANEPIVDSKDLEKRGKVWVKAAENGLMMALAEPLLGVTSEKTTNGVLIEYRVRLTGEVIATARIDRIQNRNDNTTTTAWFNPDNKYTLKEEAAKLFTEIEKALEKESERLTGSPTDPEQDKATDNPAEQTQEEIDAEMLADALAAMEAEQAAAEADTETEVEAKKDNDFKTGSKKIVLDKEVRDAVLLKIEQLNKNFNKNNDNLNSLELRKRKNRWVNAAIKFITKAIESQEGFTVEEKQKHEDGTILSVMFNGEEITTVEFTKDPPTDKFPGEIYFFPGQRYIYGLSKAVDALVHEMAMEQVRADKEGITPDKKAPAPEPEKKTVSWKMEVKADGKWQGNSNRYATKAEAEEAGRELLTRWLGPSESRAVESSDPVTKPSKPKTAPAPAPAPAPDKPLTPTQQAWKDANDAAKDLGDMLGGSLGANQFLDPKIMAGVIKTTSAFINAGVVTFAELAKKLHQAFKDNYGIEKANEYINKVKVGIQAAWNTRRKTKPELDEATNVESIVSNITQGASDGSNGSDNQNNSGDSDSETESDDSEAGSDGANNNQDGNSGSGSRSGQSGSSGTSTDNDSDGNESGSDLEGDDSGTTGSDSQSDDDTGDGQSSSSERDPGTNDSKRRGKPNARNLRYEEGDTVIPTSTGVQRREDLLKVNLEAVRLLKLLEEEDRLPRTKEEQMVLAKYTGWGWGKEMLNAHARQGRDRDAYAQIKDLLTDAEFAEARASTLNAHYTDLPIVKGLWDIVQKLGFEGGNVLEPSMGNGHFFGMMPENISDNSKLYGVEKDDLSARISKKLYPDADIRHSGYEKAKLPNNSMDLVISNIPFGGFPVAGAKDYKSRKLMIHDYFFKRSMDKVRPGGLVVFITSSGTLNKGGQEVRKALAKKGDLVGAIRLPNDAFLNNAGTAVTTDIVIIRKKDDSDFKGEPFLARRESDATYKKVRRFKLPNGKSVMREQDTFVEVNEYFVEHPEMVLGEHGMNGKLTGKEHEYTLNPHLTPESEGLPPHLQRSVPLEPLLQEAIENLPNDIMGEQDADKDAVDDIDYAEDHVKEKSFTIVNGKIKQNVNGILVTPDWQKRRGIGKNPDDKPTADMLKKRNAIAKKWIPLKLAAMKMIRAEYTLGIEESVLDTLRADLNKKYDAFILEGSKHKKLKLGFRNTLNKKTPKAEIANFLNDDPEYQYLQGFEAKHRREITDGLTGEVTLEPEWEKGDIFHKRIGWPDSKPTSADTVEDAISITMGYSNNIKTEEIAELLGVSENEAFKSIIDSGRAFLDPASGGFVTKEKYLSGNVRLKLIEAESASESDPRYENNVKALEKVQPKRVEIGNITINTSARWIPLEVQTYALNRMMGARGEVRFVSAIGKYNIYQPGNGPLHASGHAAEVKYGTERVNGVKIMKHALNSTLPVVKINGEINADATEAAVQKVADFKEDFEKFIQTGLIDGVPQEMNFRGDVKPVWEVAEDAYNKKNNSSVAPSYDGSYLKLPGLAPFVQRKPHLLSVVARILQEGSAVMAHGVGSGKTFALIVAAMEMKRLGLAKKPMIVVKKSTLNQFTESFRKAYPSANLLVSTKETFQKANRNKLMAQVSLNQYDCIIVTQPQFNGLDDSIEEITQYIDEQIAAYEASREATNDTQTIRQLENAIADLRAKLEEVIAERSANSDNMLDFRDLGVDALFMDEGHAYKKIPINTKLGSIKSVPTDVSQCALGLLLKALTIQKNNNGRNVIVATGTPITNTSAEAFVMLKLATPNVLDDYGIHTFDDFAHNFIQTETKLEFGWKNDYKYETRLTEFINGQEFITMMRSGFDVKMGNQKLGIDVPNIVGGKPEIVVVPQTKTMETVRDVILDIADNYDEHPDRFLMSWAAITTMGFGLAAALDPRLVDSTLPDDPDSKTNVAVKRVFEIWEDTKKNKSTQMIFADRYNPMSLDRLSELMPPDGGIGFKDSYPDFNLHEDIKKKLVKMGIPEHEIAIVNDYNDSDDKMQALFDQVNLGNIRILLGGTDVMGVGVNAQKKLIALHNLDPPMQMTPAMLEQRIGRIIRQGNENKEVYIINYGSHQSLDEGIYQKLETKQRMITRALMGEIKGRSFKDAASEDAANFSEMQGQLSGNPIAMERVTLIAEVNKLRNKQSAFITEQGASRRRIRQAQTDNVETQQDIDYFENQLAKFNPPASDEDVMIVTPAGKGKRGKDASVEWLQHALEVQADGLAEQSSFEMRDFKFSLFDYKVSVVVSGGGGTDVSYMTRWAARDVGGRTLSSTKGKTAKGIISAIIKTDEALEKRIAQFKKTKEGAESLITSLEGTISGEWPHEKELDTKRERLRLIEAQLVVATAEARQARLQRRRDAASNAAAINAANESEGGEGLASMRRVGAKRKSRRSKVDGQKIVGPFAEQSLPRVKPEPTNKDENPVAHSQRDIINLLSDAITTHIKKGRMPARYLGMHVPADGRTLIRNAGDMDTATHEAGHRLDHMYGMMKPWWSKEDQDIISPLDEELSKFSDHGSKANSLAVKRSEGFAEWFRAYLVNPEEAKRLAPMVYDRFLKKVPKEVIEDLEKPGKAVRDWVAADAMEKIGSNIRTRLPRTRKERKAEQAARSRTYDFGFSGLDENIADYVDALHPVMKGVQAAMDYRDIKDLDPNQDPRVLFRLYSGAGDKIKDFMEHGIRRANGKVRSDAISFNQLFDMLDRDNLTEEMEIVQRFMVAERVLEKAMQITDKRVTEELILKDQLANGEIEEDRYKIEMKNLLIKEEHAKRKISGSGGGFSNDEKVAWEALRPYFTTEKGQSKPKVFPEKYRIAAKRYRKWAMHALQYQLDKGLLSQEDYDTIRNSNQFYASFKREQLPEQPRGTQSSKAIGNAKETVHEYKGSTSPIDNLYVSLLMQSSEMIKEADRNFAIKALVDLISPGGGHENDATSLHEVGYKTMKGEKDAFKVVINGKDQYYSFHPTITAALKGLDQDVLTSMALKWGKIPQFTRTMITYSPDFIARNFYRDAFSRAILSQNDSSVWDSAKGGVKGYDKQGKEYSDFRTFGGGQAGHYRNGKENWEREVLNHMDEVADQPNTVVQSLGTVVDWWKHVAENVETRGRMAEFRRALVYAQKELGYDYENANLYAASQARGLMDYAIMGSKMKTFNYLVPFTNAAIQSLRRASIEYKTSPSKLFQKAMSVTLPLTLVEAAYLMMNDDDEEEYWQMPAWRRDLFWNFKMMDGLWLTIPKPFELGLPASTISRVWADIRGDQHAYEGLLSSAAKSLSPVDAGVLTGPFTPFVEVGFNYDSFRGKHIVGMWEENLKVSKRKGTKYASPMGQVIQDITLDSMDARYADHLIKGIGGSIGRLAIDASNVGQEGKDAFQPARKASGHFTHEPTWGARDVVWVREHAVSNGKQIPKTMKRIIDKLSSAKTQSDRTKIGRQLRAFATKERAKQEKRDK